MSSRHPVRLALFGCAAALAGAACGATTGGDAASDAGVGTSASSMSTVGAVEDSGAVVPDLMQFTAPLIGGGEIAGDELADKPTAFWFWSPT